MSTDPERHADPAAAILPLHGVAVLELSHAIAGPHCGQILADHGADVIKIEPPGGERGRAAPPFVADESLYFACHNRGKRSVCLDVKHPGGLAVLLELCDRADVVLTNYRADVPGRLGWPYEVLSQRNPALVFAQITGFGTTGEHREVRAYDGIIQAMSGIPDLTGPAAGPPVFAGAFIADHVTAYQAAMGILMALVGRASSGRGAFLDIAMFDAYFALLGTDVGEAAAGEPRVRSANKVLTGFSDVFATSDGAVFLAPLGGDAWSRFCPAVGHPEWLDAVSYDESIGPARAGLEQGVADWAAARTTAQATDEMIAAGVACGPVRSISQAVAAAQQDGRGMVAQVTGALGTEMVVPGAPVPFGLSQDPLARTIPALGTHTAAVLGEYGFSPAQIAELAARDVLRLAT